MYISVQEVVAAAPYVHEGQEVIVVGACMYTTDTMT